jgi:hypothetical protein
MTAFVLAVTLLPPVVIGYLVVRSLAPAFHPQWAGFVFTLTLGAGLGVGILSLLYFLTRLLLGLSNAAYGELLLAGLAGALCWRHRGRSSTAGSGSHPKSWSWLLLVGLSAAIAMALVLFLDTAQADPYGHWDAWAIWNLRAKVLTQHNSSWKDAFSPALNQLAGAGATHGDYPLLLSGYVARCWSLLGTTDDNVPPIAVAGLFSFATIGLMGAGLAILRGWSAAMMGGLLLLGTAGFLLQSPWQLADIPLGFYYLSTLLLLFLFDATQGRSATAVLAGFAVGCAAWTKDEGMAFALVASLTFAVYLVHSGQKRAVSPLAFFVLGALAPGATALCFKMFLAPKGIWGPVTLSSIVHQLMQASRYEQIIKAFWDEGAALGTGMAHPAVCLGILAVSLGVPRERLRQPIVIASAGAWLAMLAAYFLSYLATPLDLSWHLGTSSGRLLVQLVPSAIFLAIAACRTAEETAVRVESAQKPANSGKKMRRTQKR